MAAKKPRKLRVVKKTHYDKQAKKTREWYEVQYQVERWVTFTSWNSNITFEKKAEAIEFSMRKKLGVPTNGIDTEVVA